MPHKRRLRCDIQTDFIRLFAEAEDKAPETSIPDFSGTEEELQTVLPSSYKEFLSRQGAARRFSIDLSLASDTRPVYPEFSKLFGHAELLKANNTPWVTPVFSHITGLGEDTLVNVFDFMVAFTMDGGGNLVCFPRCRVPNDDLPVFFFDHDLGGVHQVSPSFDQFLQWYVRHLDLKQMDDHPSQRTKRASRRPPLVFSAENDHNPTYTEECERCGGFGQLFIVRYERPRRLEDDVPCPACGGSGSVIKYLFSNNNPPREIRMDGDGWIKCPNCGWRFSTNDKNAWSGYRHKKCGQRLIVH